MFPARVAAAFPTTFPTSIESGLEGYVMMAWAGSLFHRVQLVDDLSRLQLPETLRDMPGLQLHFGAAILDREIVNCSSVN